jgi:hypothetical protein
MRVSGALQRMGHIAHESLRSCSVPLIDGSMRDERAAIQLNLAAIDSELCDILAFYCCPAVLAFFALIYMFANILRLLSSSMRASDFMFLGPKL